MDEKIVMLVCETVADYSVSTNENICMDENEANVEVHSPHPLGDDA